MTGRLILVRHGQTTSNVVRKLDTLPPGAELTAMGRYQAHRVGVELAEFCGVAPGHKGRIQSVTTSVAIRAQQTSMILARALEHAATLPRRAMNVQVRAGIHEVAAGDYEMRGDDDAHREYVQAMFGWLRGDPEARTPRAKITRSCSADTGRCWKSWRTRIRMGMRWWSATAPQSGRWPRMRRAWSRRSRWKTT